MKLTKQMVEVFGFQVPTDTYYLHRGHAWAVVEDTNQVRVGLDDFSQKLSGPVDELKLPTVGSTYFQDHVCLSLVRQGRRASFEAPVDSMVTAVNPKIRENPRLIHDDPYGEGWIFTATPINLKRNLDHLHSGDDNVAFIDQEAHRLLDVMSTTIGVTLPTGGTIADDVIGQYPDLDWRRLIKDFFLQNVSRDWKKRA